MLPLGEPAGLLALAPLVIAALGLAGLLALVPLVLAALGLAVWSACLELG